MTAVCAWLSSGGSASNHRNPYEVVVGASVVRPVWRNRATSLNGDHGRSAVRPLSDLNWPKLAEIGRAAIGRDGAKAAAPFGW